MDKKEIIDDVKSWLQKHIELYDYVTIDITVERKGVSEIANSESKSLHVKCTGD